MLAFVPSAGTPAFAQVHAQRGALCVVETKSTPLAEWAAAVSAEDLTSPGQTAKFSLAPEVRDRLDFTFGFGGSNGFVSPDEKAHVRRVLGDSSAESLSDVDAIVGYMLGQGSPDYGIKNIKKIVEQINR
ncbi:hypothetical protein [Actinomadura rudentiformis]|uniref:Uncharacterized protein n=1 Tax=Actinomadura rudentiformis TaxID=359158 RepID=A0A6H9YJ51_9ACTN|nr:hypothetical protein [Actinomadura rudentiformis]KAB2340880.1 hypothetical protein F8566_44010 [Actinomadura rudentiformis]